MRRLLLVVGLVLGGLLAATAGAGAASKNTGSFQWVAGMEPVEGPNVSVAADGSTLTLEGEGEFTVGDGPPSISGGGEYTLTDPAGNVVASGAWAMTHFEGFVSYGTFPELEPVDPGDPLGGTLRAQIELEGLGTGHIWLYCTIGTPPPPTKPEGVRVDIGRWHFEPAGEEAGQTIFFPL
jgi:hypothetical protein